MIAITEKLFLVEVPKDARAFSKSEDGNITYLYGNGMCKINLKGFKLHGLIQCPELKFEFKYGTGSYDTMVLKSRTQKAIQDSGRLLVNHYECPTPIINYTGIGYNQKGTIENTHDIDLYEEAESKLIRGNLVLIEKI